MPVSIHFDYLDGFVSERELDEIAPEVLAAQRTLSDRCGSGREFLGWLEPSALNRPEELTRLSACARRIIADSDVVLVVGIGGSYLGARAAIDYLLSPLYNSLPKNTPDIWFVGNDLSASHLTETLTLCEGRRVSAIVISKSGTTTEPAVAFRAIKRYLSRRYGDLAAARIVAVTDCARGALRQMADAEGFESFVIPDAVGGRYSVLTPVGLLPIAVAGIDIERLLAGAAAA
ncbi:MAG: glucose-6-phosphate isomerase, partial [Oscillospiraceae bacterium]